MEKIYVTITPVNQSLKKWEAKDLLLKKNKRDEFALSGYNASIFEKAEDGEEVMVLLGSSHAVSDFWVMKLRKQIDANGKLEVYLEDMPDEEA